MCSQNVITNNVITLGGTNPRWRGKDPRVPVPVWEKTLGNVITNRGYKSPVAGKRP